MSNLNTIENVMPIIENILEKTEMYDGFEMKYGYFDSAKLDGSVFTIYNYKGDYITSWDLSVPVERSDLMTRTFYWLDVISVN